MIRKNIEQTNIMKINKNFQFQISYDPTKYFGTRMEGRYIVRDMEQPDTVQRNKYSV